MLAILIPIRCIYLLYGLIVLRPTEFSSVKSSSILMNHERMDLASSRSQLLL